MGWKIGIDLEAHKVVPELEVHDLLIMRADVIHRTHDTGCDRISIRCDAMPRHAPRHETWSGLFKLSPAWLATGKKRRYSLGKWLKNEWSKRLRRLTA